MTYVCVKDQHGFEVELKLEGDFVVSDFMNTIKDIYKLEQIYTMLQVEPIGKVLTNDATLFEQGVETGSVITLV